MNPPLSILYVDDDPDIRRIVEMALGLDPSLDTQIASSGAEAIAILAKPGWRPDVIVLDVMMPGMDGLAALQAIRAMPGMADTVILFMTAKGRDDDLKAYHAHGANGVMIKPFDPLQLATDIRAFAARR